MDSQEAAQAVFPSLARSLQKYLRVTRQQPRHSAEQVVRHLSQCLSFDMSPRSFLERFFNTQETLEVRRSKLMPQKFTRSMIGHIHVYRPRQVPDSVYEVCEKISLTFLRNTDWIGLSSVMLIVLFTVLSPLMCRVGETQFHIRTCHTVS